MNTFAMGAYRRPSIDSNCEDEDTAQFDDESEVSNLTYEEALDSVRFGRYHYALTVVAGKRQHNCILMR